MNDSGKKKSYYVLIGIVITFILVGIDQLTKIMAVLNLKDNSIILVENIFQLQYLENRGAAFGILQGQKLFFIIITLVVLIIICNMYIKIPREKRFNLLRFVMILFVSGAIGNMIDRIRLNYVIDFLYFELINFAIFNIADCYVTVAAALLIILFLFVYKEEELNFMFQLRRKGMKKENE